MAGTFVSIPNNNATVVVTVVNTMLTPESCTVCAMRSSVDNLGSVRSKDPVIMNASAKKDKHSMRGLLRNTNSKLYFCVEG